MDLKSTQRWDWAPTLTEVWKWGEKSPLKLISLALSLIKQKQMQIQRQPFPSLAMHNVGGTDRWRKAPERKISQKWEKKENMSNEQVPGLPQLHDPILSWYVLLLLEYFSSEVSTPITSGRELEIQLQVEILSTLIEHKEFLCTLRNERLVSNPAARCSFCWLINN